MIGTLIDGKYRVVRQIGAGGMGAVYEAVHDGTGRRVALKVIVSRDLEANSDMVVRFQREARAAGAIDTEHIVQIFDTGTDAVTKHPFMVMEYLSGQDVSQLVRRVGPLPPDLALRAVTQAASGLQKAHDAGVVHRDIKPANLFLARREATTIVVKVLDFGIAKVTTDLISNVENAHLTRTGSMLGSPLYMSPEQARGAKSIDCRTDIWSLGVVLYEALTGRTPNGTAESLGDLIIAICSERARPVQDFAPWVSADLARIVHKALEINPAQRFQSMRELIDAMHAHVPVVSIDERMLTALSPQMRAYVAPRLDVLSTTPLALPTPGPISDRAMIAAGASGPHPLYASGERGSPAISQGGHMVSQGGHAISQGGVSAPLLTPSAPPARSSMGTIVGFAVLAVALVVLGGLVIRQYVVKQRTASASSIASAPPPPPASSPPVAVAAPADTSVTRILFVEPPSATVDVDGTTVDVDGGAVSIRGAPGDTRQVRVTAGKSTKDEAVVITKDGLSIDKITVPPEKAVGGAVRPPPPPVKPVAAKPAPATSTPRSNAGISRQTDEFGK